MEPQPAAAPVSGPTVAREAVTSDGTRLAIVPVARTERPSALAVANDGTLFVGAASGVVRVVHDGIVVGETALAAADAPPGEGRGILDLALDPQFERTHLVYVLDTTGAASPAFRLSRYREVGGRLGERAVLVDGVAASPQRPSGALAFGPDARLYLALDDGGDPESAARAASYNGKVLRLSAAGTIAVDQAAGTPVYASNLHSPRSLSWDLATAALWMADAATERAARVRGRERSAVTTAYRLPLAEGPGSVAVYRGSLIAGLQGDLLVAPLEDGAYLLRARVSDGGQNTLAFAERLAIAGFGSLHLVEVGADGAIYVGTDEGVLRIAPR
jgi:glucose/arabinose dehydrogenase